MTKHDELQNHNLIFNQKCRTISEICERRKTWKHKVESKEFHCVNKGSNKCNVGVPDLMQGAPNSLKNLILNLKFEFSF